MGESLIEPLTLEPMGIGGRGGAFYSVTLLIFKLSPYSKRVKCSK